MNEGLIMFACPDVDDAESLAKDYIREMNLTNKDVKIIRSNGQMLVKATRDIE